MAETRARGAATGLNRTFMELKQAMNKEERLNAAVLIEPLWN